MGISVIPAPSAASKTMFRTTLTSGTSYTVPAGVTYLNVTLVGGGGGGSGYGNNSDSAGWQGLGGQIVQSTFTTTPGASISYSIGAGGTGGAASQPHNGGTGGSTTMTGATTAAGGGGAIRNFGTTGNAGQAGLVSNNGGQPQNWSSIGGAGGAGCIVIEYWV
jgi:hypothetical protein